MMKKFLAILLALTLMLTLCACGEKEVEEKEEKEPVGDYIAEAKALIEKEKYEKAYKLLYTHKSDKEAAELMKDFRWVYKKESYTSTHDDDPSLGNTYSYEYVFNKNGDRIREIHTTDSRVNTREITYTYDAEGKVLQITSTDSDGNVCEDTFTYDANGNEIAWATKYNGDFQLSKYTYDADGRMIKCVSHISGFIYTTVNTYDAAGHKINAVSENTRQDGVGKTEYSYDAAGNMIKEVIFREGALVNTIEYSYDDNGNVTKEVRTDADGDVFTTEYSYTYDAYGNIKKKVWVEQGFVANYEYSGYKVFYKPQE